MSHRYAFSVKTVLRLTGWPLLQNYFRDRTPLFDQAWLDGDTADVKAITASIDSLPAEIRVDIDQDIRDVYQLADDDGMRLIFEEARCRSIDLAAVFTELASPYDAAMWTLLNHEMLFGDLLKLHNADNLSKRLWRRRHIGRGLRPDTSDSELERLSRTLSAYLVREEGRGHQCFVERIVRDSGDLLLAYPEDFGSTVLEYQGDDLIRRTIRPTTDILFHFNPESGMLDVFSHGSKRKIRALLEIYCVVILGIPLPADNGPATMYNLDKLKDPSFSFRLESVPGLQDIEVKWIQVRDRDGGRGVTLEVGGQPGRGVLLAAQKYWSIELGEVTDKYPFHQMDIQKVKLQAAWRPLRRGRRGRTRTFTVSTNGSLLDHEGIDGQLRQVLANSGLERAVTDNLAA